MTDKTLREALVDAFADALIEYAGGSSEVAADIALEAIEGWEPTEQVLIAAGRFGLNINKPQTLRERLRGEFRAALSAACSEVKS